MAIKKRDMDTKRVLVPAPQRPRTLIRPHIDVMLSDSYVILKTQLNILRDKASKEELDVQDMKKLKILTDQLTKLASEEREQTKDRYNYSDMDDEDIIELIPEALKALGGGNGTNHSE